MRTPSPLASGQHHLQGDRPSLAIRVQRCGQWIHLDHDILPGCFLAPLHQLIEEADGDVPHVDLLHPGRAVPNAGLVPVIRHLAAPHGLAVDVRESRPIARFTRKDSPTATDESVVEFIRTNERGTIAIGPGIEREQLVAQLIRALVPIDEIPPEVLDREPPRERPRVGLLATTKRVVGQVAHHLRQLGIAARRASDRSARDRRTDVVVGLPVQFGDPDLDFGHLDVVIVWDAATVAGERMQLVLFAMDARFRLFGLARLGESLSPREQAFCMAAFGPERIEIPRHGFVTRRVITDHLRFSGSSPATTTPAATKRHGIHRHAHRNRVLARRARDLAEGRVDREFQALGNRAPHRTVLLTDSIEQAAELGRRLPTWPIVTDVFLFENGLGQVQLETLTRGRRRSTDAPGLIATTAGLRRLDQPVDAIVWAGSGPAAPPIPERHLIAPHGECHPLLLVDLDDRHHPLLRRWSRERREDCRHREWHPPGVDPVTARIERFLALAEEFRR